MAGVFLMGMLGSKLVGQGTLLLNSFTASVACQVGLFQADVFHELGFPFLEALMLLPNKLTLLLQRAIAGTQCPF